MSLLPVCILAGGLATRMRPLTETVPKALLEVAGKPFIDWQLRYLRAQGADLVVVCSGYLGEQIETFVGDGSRWGLRVRFRFDGPQLLGTGGAVANAIDLLGPRFFVLYGDSYLPIDYAAVERDFMAQAKPALMTVMKNANQWDRSNVVFRDGRIMEYNKAQPDPQATHIDYGLAVLDARVLQQRVRGTALDLAGIYHDLSVRGELAGHEVFQRFYEIGSPQGLRETAQYLEKEKPE